MTLRVTIQSWRSGRAQDPGSTRLGGAATACSGAADPSRSAKTAAPLRREASVCCVLPASLCLCPFPSRVAASILLRHLREALEKQEKLSKTSPEGSKMKPRGFKNHPRRFLGRSRVPSERSGGGFGKLLGLSRDAPERSWAPLGYLLGCLGVYLCVVLDYLCVSWKCPRRK